MNVKSISDKMSEDSSSVYTEDGVNILGSNWAIEYITSDNDSCPDQFKNDEADGLTDDSSQIIYINFTDFDSKEFDDFEVHIKRVLRHEIIHAFLSESGLAESSGISRYIRISQVQKACARLW